MEGNMSIGEYAKYGMTKEGLATGEEIVLEILTANKDRQLSFKEIMQLVDHRIGIISVRYILSRMYKNRTDLKMRRFAHNRCTYQLK